MFEEVCRVSLEELKKRNISVDEHIKNMLNYLVNEETLLNKLLD